MYINTGKGGSFFREIYFWMGIPTLREKPVTKEDFLKYGSNERVFSDYLSYVKRLYGEFFIANNDVVPTLQRAKVFADFRNKSFENITTPKGTKLRMNRSIQVEGAFGVLKQDYGFRRFLTRGKENVNTEMLFLCFAYNINKLHNKTAKNRRRTHLFEKLTA